MTTDQPVPGHPKQRTPYEHFREAERLLFEAARKRERFENRIAATGSRPLTGSGAFTEDELDLAGIELDLAAAQAHALLATVQRTLS